MNPVTELREAAERIRETPRCTDVHDGCDCEFSDQLVFWLEKVADDLAVALDTARKVLAATEPAPKPGLDYLPEPVGMLAGSHPALKAGV